MRIQRHALILLVHLLLGGAAYAQVDRVAPGPGGGDPVLTRHRDPEFAETVFSAHGMAAGEGVRFFLYVGIPGLDLDPNQTPTLLRSSTSYLAVNVDRFESNAYFDPDEIYSLRATFFDVSGRRRNTNFVSFNDAPTLYMMVEGAAGEGRLIRLHPGSDAPSRVFELDTPEMLGSESLFAVAGASNSVFYESRDSSLVNRNRDDWSLSGFRAPLMQPGEKILDLIAGAGRDRLLVLSTLPKDGARRRIFKMNVYDPASNHWANALDLLEADLLEAGAEERSGWMLSGEQSEHAYFASDSAKLRRLNLVAVPDAGPWIYPSPDRFREELVNAAATRNHIVSLLRRHDGLGGRLSVTDLAGRPVAPSVVPSHVPVRMQAVEGEDGVLSILVAERTVDSDRASRLSLYSFDQNTSRLALVDDRQINGGDWVMSTTGDFVFLLEGGEVYRIDLNRMSDLRPAVQGVGASSETHGLGILTTRDGYWLYLIDPLRGSQSLRMWRFEAGTHRLLTFDAIEPEVGGTVLRVLPSH